MSGSTVRRAAMVAVALAALTVSCGSDPAASPAAQPSASTASSASHSPEASPGATGPTGAPGKGAGAATPPLSTEGASPAAKPANTVRDAFAGLQATLGDSCTPGNCAFFLGRVYDELHRMDRAMKADPKGAGHFPEPIALIAKLDEELGGDRAFENLKKHQTLLIATRDKINTWMQDHPEDYR
uniref:Lipoprotein n=1 Tax=Streptomyces sp. NBC_00049 TaxID=2903617 RepID=A0AAU2JHQ4_9ACTN